MSWPSTVGSLAATESGLRATGDGEPTASTEGDAAGEAAGLAAAEGLAAGLGARLAAGLAAGAVVGFGAAVAAGALVGADGVAEQPRASSSVAVAPTPPVMFNTRRTRSRRERKPAR